MNYLIYLGAIVFAAIALLIVVDICLAGYPKTLWPEESEDEDAAAYVDAWTYEQLPSIQIDEPPVVHLPSPVPFKPRRHPALVEDLRTRQLAALVVADGQRKGGQ